MQRYLGFGLGEKTEADGRAHPAGDKPYAKSACVPQRIERAGAVP